MRRRRGDSFLQSVLPVCLSVWSTICSPAHPSVCQAFFSVFRNVCSYRKWIEKQCVCVCGCVYARGGEYLHYFFGLSLSKLGINLQPIQKFINLIIICAVYNYFKTLPTYLAMHRSANKHHLPMFNNQWVSIVYTALALSHGSLRVRRRPCSTQHTIILTSSHQKSMTVGLKHQIFRYPRRIES